MLLQCLLNPGRCHLQHPPILYVAKTRRCERWWDLFALLSRNRHRFSRKCSSIKTNAQNKMYLDHFTAPSSCGVCNKREPKIRQRQRDNWRPIEIDEWKLLIAFRWTGDDRENHWFLKNTWVYFRYYRYDLCTHISLCWLLNFRMCFYDDSTQERPTSALRLCGVVLIWFGVNFISSGFRKLSRGSMAK